MAERRGRGRPAPHATRHTRPAELRSWTAEGGRPYVSPLRQSLS